MSRHNNPKISRKYREGGSTNSFVTTESTTNFAIHDARIDVTAGATIDTAAFDLYINHKRRKNRKRNPTANKIKPVHKSLRSAYKINLVSFRFHHRQWAIFEHLISVNSFESM